jgi:hypothetical protein
MKIECDCGRVVFEREVPAPDGDKIETSIGLDITVFSIQKPATMFEVNCPDCGRVPVRIYAGEAPDDAEPPEIRLSEPVEIEGSG